MDERRWNASKEGSFSVKSFFEVINKRDGIGNSVANIWKLKALPRVVVFGWLALQKKILTMDNLRKRGKIIVNGSPMC